MSTVSHPSPVEELAVFLARRPTSEEIAAFRLSEAALERARELQERNKDGALTTEESHELDQLVLLDDIIALIQLYASSPGTLPGANGDGPSQSART